MLGQRRFGKIQTALLVVIALVIGASLISPAVGHVKKSVKHLYKHLDPRYVNVGEKATSAGTADTATNATNATNATTATGLGQVFYRQSAQIAVPAAAGSFTFGEIACPAGTRVTGGGFSATGPQFGPAISTPTDGTGSFVTNVGAAGAGFTGWGVVIINRSGGAGTFRVYAICVTAPGQNANYAGGSSTYRSAAGVGAWGA